MKAPPESRKKPEYISGSIYVPPYGTTDTEKIICNWFGNECRLDKPIFQYNNGGMFNDGSVEKITLGYLPQYSLARIRYTFTDSTEIPSYKKKALLTIRATNSKEEPFLFEGQGELELLVNENCQIEYRVDLNDSKAGSLRLAIELLGWKVIS